MKLVEAIDFNPRESISKNSQTRKISMEKLSPFYKFIDGCEYERYSGGSKFRNGDTLVARITPCLENGKTAFVDLLKDDEVAFGSTEFIVMRAKKGITIPDYVYYLAITPWFRNKAISLMTGTSGRQRVQIDPLKTAERNFPSVTDQKKITKILVSIDNKIRLNNEINNNLYELLNKLFEEKFINYKDKNEFHRIKLKDLISIRGGFAYKASSISKDENDSILVSMGNVELNNIFNFNNLKYYSDEVDKKYIATSGDMFICTRDVTQMRNQLGCPGIIPKIFKKRTVIIGTNLYIVDILSGYNDLIYYLFLLLNSKPYRDKISGSASGTAILMIKKDDILEYEFDFPNNIKEVESFVDNIKPIYNKIENNFIQNKELEQLRDTLLPKLMNGEIDLDNIEI